MRLVTGAEAVKITEVRAALEVMLAAKAAQCASVGNVARLNDILVEMRQAIADDNLIGYRRRPPTN